LVLYCFASSPAAVHLFLSLRDALPICLGELVIVFEGQRSGGALFALRRAKRNHRKAERIWRPSDGAELRTNDRKRVPCVETWSRDRKRTRLSSSHVKSSDGVYCFKQKT